MLPINFSLHFMEFIVLCVLTDLRICNSINLFRHSKNIGLRIYRVECKKIEEEKKISELETIIKNYEIQVKSSICFFAFIRAYTKFRTLSNRRLLIPMYYLHAFTYTYIHTHTLN